MIAVRATRRERVTMTRVGQERAIAGGVGGIVLGAIILLFY